MFKVEVGDLLLEIRDRRHGGEPEGGRSGAFRVTADADVIIAADTLAGEPPDVITEDLLEAVQSGELIGFGVCRCPMSLPSLSMFPVCLHHLRAYRRD